jgi:hypothetical protein
VYDSPSAWLTVDRKTFDDPYVIKYEYHDADGNPVRVKCDARAMDRAGLNKPGLGRYAFIDERLCNVKFVNKGVGTWGFRVRDGRQVHKGDEIFREF